MAKRRQPGSDAGRPAVDWEAAFAYYASLPATDRSYQAVADHYQLSVRTVETHGRQEQWKKRLHQLQTDAAARLNEELTGRLADSLTSSLQLVDATFTRYALQLQAGTVRVTPTDLARMVALQQTITDTLNTITTTKPPEPDDHQDIDQAAHTLEVLRALNETGALDRLQHLLNPQPDTSTDQPAAQDAA